MFNNAKFLWNITNWTSTNVHQHTCACIFH